MTSRCVKEDSPTDVEETDEFDILLPVTVNKKRLIACLDNINILI